MRGRLNKNSKRKIYAKFYNSMRLLKTSGLVIDNKVTEVHTNTHKQFGIY